MAKNKNRASLARNNAEEELRLATQSVSTEWATVHVAIAEAWFSLARDYDYADND